MHVSFTFHQLIQGEFNQIAEAFFIIIYAGSNSGSYSSTWKALYKVYEYYLPLERGREGKMLVYVCIIKLNQSNILRHSDAMGMRVIDRYW